ncbi:MAG: monovalent cation:proton antiporter-2 (CPA2) family protein [Betaproteobacteria bacterium]|jgi:CPA2 family monovalent cation:H+ antiporter-2|nr:monovalent cation:proton antiporter-2 (CPA2) family protein [Betaproteobacteria bacterium]
MQPHESIPHLREIVVFLVAAGIVVPFFSRLRMSPVLGFLALGALLGPYGLGLFADEIGVLRFAVIDDIEGVRPLAELGVVFLLFMIGLELSPERLWALRRLVFGLGTLQVTLTAAVIGTIAWAFGNPPGAALILGMAFALSSTAVVMQLLVERRAVASPLGRASFAILLLQDLAVVPILMLVSVLATRADAGVPTALGTALLTALVTIAGIFLAGRLVLRPLFRIASATRSPELFMAVTLLAALGTAALTHAAGLSMALGAFLAGLLIAETEYRHEIEVDIEPFKGLLLGLFFMSVGMGTDFRVVAEEHVWLVASVVGLFALKAPITAGLCRLFGLPRHTAVEVGLLLGQGGEFAFVVVGIAAIQGLLPRDTAQFMLLVTALSMMVTPLMAILARRAGRALERDHAGRGVPDEARVPRELAGHVIIAGFGRVGQMLARVFDACGMQYVALDVDAAAVAQHRANGLPVFYGDASRVEILRRMHAERAQGVVVTTDSPVSAQHTVHAVRRQWPHLLVVARARDSSHARYLLDCGASEVVPETVEASLQLAGRMLEAAGEPVEAVSHALAQQREYELAKLELEGESSPRRVRPVHPA